MTTTTHTPTPRTDKGSLSTVDIFDMCERLERELAITTDALRTIAALSNAPTRHVDDYGDLARTALRDAGLEVAE